MPGRVQRCDEWSLVLLFAFVCMKYLWKKKRNIDGPQRRGLGGYLLIKLKFQVFFIVNVKDVICSVQLHFIVSLLSMLWFIKQYLFPSCPVVSVAGTCFLI